MNSIKTSSVQSGSTFLNFHNVYISVKLQNYVFNIYTVKSHQTKPNLIYSDSKIFQFQIIYNKIFAIGHCFNAYIICIGAFLLTFAGSAPVTYW